MSPYYQTKKAPNTCLLKLSKDGFVPQQKMQVLLTIIYAVLVVRASPAPRLTSSAQARASLMPTRVRILKAKNHESIKILCQISRAKKFRQTTESSDKITNLAWG